MPRDRSVAQDGFGRAHRRILQCAAPLLLAACEGPQSLLDPAGPSARAIAGVWWWMFGVAGAVLLFVVIVWLLAMRRERALPAEQASRVGRRWIVGGGIVLPTAAITALLVFGSPAGLHQLPLPGGAQDGRAPLRIDAIGHQWWWELHYPDTGLRLRNELRVPVGRPIDIHTSSRDVIHSFWVPRLGGKLDAVPGRTLVVRLQADEPGVFRGQCAEFCGLGHAHMTMTVRAMEPAAFEAWLQAQPTAAEAKPAATAATSDDD
ncbi:MAG: cytochrome c oxidase subunit II [Methylibium sp.]|nr:cytochrome c oxidase subunit II [Methylibium sp.]